MAAQTRTRFLCALHALAREEAQVDELRSVLRAMCDGGCRTLRTRVETYAPASFQGFDTLGEMRALCDVGEDGSEGPWRLETLGPPLPGHRHETHVRTQLRVPVGDNYGSFLAFLGYRRELSYEMRGWVYGHGAHEVRVFRASAADGGGAEGVAPWLVEARSVATDDNIGPAEQNLVAFARLLEPVVHFSKV